jgi:hypothetical protein
MKNHFSKLLVLTITTFSISSCSYRPILDHNEKYNAAGEEKAGADIKTCKKEAADYLDKYKAERVVKEAGRKAIIGSVVGTAAGLIWGGGVRSILGGAAIGAAAGGAIGGLSEIGKGQVNPDEIKQRHMTNCLSRKGYSVIGWI